MGSLREPERGNRVVSVHNVLGTVESSLEESRRLFGRLTRSLHLQPHPGIADNDLIQMPHFRPTFSHVIMSLCDRLDLRFSKTTLLRFGLELTQERLPWQSVISRDYRSDLLYFWVVCRVFFWCSGCIEVGRRLDQIRVCSESIAGTFDLHDDGVMQQSVQQCGGHHWVAEHFGPFSEASIRGQDHGAFFVSGTDQLKKSDWRHLWAVAGNRSHRR